MRPASPCPVNSKLQASARSTVIHKGRHILKTSVTLGPQLVTYSDQMLAVFHVEEDTFKTYHP